MQPTATGKDTTNHPSGIPPRGSTTSCCTSQGRVQSLGRICSEELLGVQQTLAFHLHLVCFSQSNSPRSYSHQFLTPLHTRYGQLLASQSPTTCRYRAPGPQPGPIAVPPQPDVGGWEVLEPLQPHHKELRESAPDLDAPRELGWLRNLITAADEKARQGCFYFNRAPHHRPRSSHAVPAPPRDASIISKTFVCRWRDLRRAANEAAWAGLIARGRSHKPSKGCSREGLGTSGALH